jgi:hypothetical protein
MNSSKWQVAMEDELISMGSNDIWDLVEIPIGAKRVGCKWGSTKLSMTPKGMSEGSKQDLWQKVSHKEKGSIIMRPSLQCHLRNPLGSSWL